MTEQDVENMYADLDKELKEEADHNLRVIQEHGIPGEALNDLLFCSQLNGKMEIVAVPKGDNQPESHEFFKEIFVDQWSEGESGDSFSGFIYGKIEDGKWLKVPYTC